MEQYCYNGLDFVEIHNLVWIKNLRDSDIKFSNKDGETCYEFDVKLLNKFEKIHHTEPRNVIIELITYSLITHGVK